MIYIPQPTAQNHHAANHTQRKKNGIDSVGLGPANQELRYLFWYGTGHVIIFQLKYPLTPVLYFVCEMSN